MKKNTQNVFSNSSKAAILKSPRTYPAGVIGNTMENLKAAAAGENLEQTVLYPEAARIADEEGFNEIAEVYRAIAEVRSGA